MTTAQRIDFVDLSHHNPVTLDGLRKARAAGVRGIYHKATEGSGYTDPTYAGRRKMADAAGLPFGAYHFARPAVGDAEAEARHFLAVAKPKAGDLLPALDLETTEGLTLAQLRTWAETWCSTVAKACGGRRPVVYSPYDLRIEGLRWRPRYNDDNRPPVLTWDVWQFSNGQLGKPDTVPGLGRVDLNTLGKGVTMADLTWAERPAPARKVQRLRLGHASMQFSDSPAQMAADVRAIFARAVNRDLAWLTGTEAGAGADPLSRLLAEAAQANGYRYYRPKTTDAWIAVRRDLIAGGWDEFYGGKVIDGKAGVSTDKGVVRVSFDTAQLGRISVLAGHFLTKGRPEASDPAYRVNAPLNTKLAQAIADEARRCAKGSALAFYGGDNNINDRTDDAFIVKGFTSVSDELRKWPNTGHGPIDVIGTWDADGRVKALRWHAFPDAELPLATDHYYCEAVVEVRELAPAKG